MNKPKWGVIAFAVILAMVLAGCGGQAATPQSQSKSSPAPAAAPTQPTAAAKVEPTAAPTQPKPTETPKPAATAVPTQPKPTETPKQEAPTGQAGLDLLKQSMRAQLSQKAWRSTMNIVDGDKTTKMVIEFVAPDRLHILNTGSQEMIIVPEGTYLRKPGEQQWTKSPMSMSSVISSTLSAKSVDDLMNSITIEKFKFVGADVVDGKPTWVYEYQTSMEITAGTTINQSAKIWIGIADKLPYRMEGESDSVTTKGAKTQTTGTYEYPADLKIVAPM